MSENSNVEGTQPLDATTQDWGELHESFKIWEGDELVELRVYRRARDENWYVYTAVDPQGKVVNQEASPRIAILSSEWFDAVGRLIRQAS